MSTIETTLRDKATGNDIAPRTTSDAVTVVGTGGNLTETLQSIKNGFYGVCSTAAATTAKTVAIDGFELVVGQLVTVQFTYAVPASATLNVNGTGAKNIYRYGLANKSTDIPAASRVIFCFNGTQFDILNIDRMDSQEDWIAPTLLNGWVNYEADNGVAGYLKDDMGFVHLKGVVKGGSGYIFLLPSGYRPSLNCAFAIVSAGVGVIVVRSDGYITLAAGSNSDVSLSGCIFRVDQN